MIDYIKFFGGYDWTFQKHAYFKAHHGLISVAESKRVITDISAKIELLVLSTWLPENTWMYKEKCFIGPEVFFQEWTYT